MLPYTILPDENKYTGLGRQHAIDDLFRSNAKPSLRPSLRPSLSLAGPSIGFRFVPTCAVAAKSCSDNLSDFRP